MTKKRQTGRRRSIVWTSRALSDLEAIGDFIAQENPRAAANWVARLIAVAEKAASAPFAGRRVPELATEEVREVLLRSYRIVYLVIGNHIEVVTIFEGHRLFPADVPRRRGER